MKHFASAGLICAVLALFTVCSREDYRHSLVGTWEWTGDVCGADGSCKKEIITDEGNREIFTEDGLYISKRAKIGYVVKGGEIRLASDRDTYDTIFGTIISINKNIMVLKKEAAIRRYTRIDGAR
jgi:hypothetical protein